MNAKFLKTGLIAIFLLGKSLHAQVWQENVNHNGYNCFVLKTSDNISVYVAKGMEGSNEMLFFKIRVPYNWGNSGTGLVKYFSENMTTKQTSSESSYFHYNNGYLYFTDYLWEWCSGDVRRGNYPCSTYTITIYEKNDHGRTQGNKIVINLQLDKLNTARMIMNRQSFETYW